MLSVPSLDSVHSVGAFLKQSEFNAPTLSTTFGLKNGLYSNLENLDTLLSQTRGDSLLAVLARLFFVCSPVEAGTVGRVIPPEILKAAVACGLLNDRDGRFEPMAIILPYDDLLLAADSAHLRSEDANIVTGPSASTRLLSQFTLRAPVRSVLDFGTGGGVLALEAASYGQHVLGTDINERAIEYARFNAALNGLPEIEFCSGDAFEPAAGRKFDRITANPPFFITPSKKFTYSDSPIELDGFSRLVAKQAPQHLEDDGFFQMLCEWVQIEGEPWPARLQEWTRDSGCDALVIQGPTQIPIEYSEKRYEEALHLYPRNLITSIPERLDYFRRMKVERIIGGLIIMHRRTGVNWFSTLSTDVGTGSPGVAVRERFDDITFAAIHSPAELLEARFRLAEDTGIEERRELNEAGRWQIVSSELAKSQGFRDRLKLDSVVAEFIGMFDGRNSVAEMADTVSKSLGWPKEEAIARCLALVRRLLQSSFIKALAIN